MGQIPPTGHTFPTPALARGMSGVGPQRVISLNSVEKGLHLSLCLYSAYPKGKAILTGMPGQYSNRVNKKK